MNIDLFISYMIRVYYPGTFTDADFIIVNAGLYTLFTERMLLEKDPQLIEAIQVHVVTAKENFEAALSCLPLTVPATMDYVLALALGVRLAGVGKDGQRTDDADVDFSRPASPSTRPRRRCRRQRPTRGCTSRSHSATIASRRCSRTRPRSATSRSGCSGPSMCVAVALGSAKVV
jgi:hypothetical protein